MHVLRNVHQSVRPAGRMLDIHPLGIDMPVLAGGCGLGFVDASEFAAVVDGVDAAADAVVAEGLFEELESRERHIVERFDTPDEAVEELSKWEDLHPPAELIERVRTAEELPIDVVEAVGYRLFKRV